MKKKILLLVYENECEHTLWIGNKLKDNHPILSWNKGRKMSDESKLKLSDSRKGIIFTDSHKYKLSTAKIGHVRSLDSRLKQSETLSESIIVITPDGELLYFNKTMEAVKFTGVNSAQIKKLIQLNKKSKDLFDELFGDK